LYIKSHICGVEILLHENGGVIFGLIKDLQGIFIRFYEVYGLNLIYS